MTNMKTCTGAPRAVRIIPAWQDVSKTVLDQPDPFDSSITVQSFNSGMVEFQNAEFPGSNWITPSLWGSCVYLRRYTILKMAVPEIKNRKPGMMTLISLAISVAFIYSLAAFIFSLGSTFFWELVSLIVIMLLGHWMEMRSIRQASGALNQLAKLMPDTAERILPSGDTEEISVSQLEQDDLFLVRPGASIPADGIIEQGESDVNEAMITGESKPVKKRRGEKIIAGTINGDGSLRAKVTAIGDKNCPGWDYALG